MDKGARWAGTAERDLLARYRTPDSLAGIARAIEQSRGGESSPMDIRAGEITAFRALSCPWLNPGSALLVVRLREANHLMLDQSGRITLLDRAWLSSAKRDLAALIGEFGSFERELDQGL